MLSGDEIKKYIAFSKENGSEVSEDDIMYLYSLISNIINKEIKAYEEKK